MAEIHQTYRKRAGERSAFSDAFLTRDRHQVWVPAWAATAGHWLVGAHQDGVLHPARLARLCALMSDPGEAALLASADLLGDGSSSSMGVVCEFMEERLRHVWFRPSRALVVHYPARP